MTIASLVVRLSAEVSDFHDKMESAAQHMEMTGRRITRAGMEITKAVAPFAAIVAGGLAAAVQKSALVHGQLAQAWDHLTLSARQLLQEIGGALTPAFLEMAAAKGGLIEKARQLVAWFEQLSPSTQRLIIETGLFLAALGPTIVAVGGAIRAFGALWKIATMLAGLIGSVLAPAIAFLVSPIGLTLLAMGLLIAGVALLIRHWQQVKQFGLEAWNAIELAVINAVDGILAGLEKLAIAAHLPGLVDTFTNARDALGVMRLNTLRQGEALDELGKHIQKLPLLPDWLRHPLTALQLKLPSLQLPAVPPIDTLAMQQAVTPLANLATALKTAQENADLFGSSFDLAAAQATAYKTAIDAILAQGTTLDAALDHSGLTLRKLAAEFQNVHNVAHVSLGPQLAQLIQGFAAAIGDVVSGATKSLKGFGAALLKVVGDTMVSLGGALIALGAAKVAALNIANPFAQIAVGAALVAFGTALSAAASAIANPVSNGGGSSAAVAPTSSSTSTASPGQGDSRIVLELHGDGAVATLFQDPRNQDALAQALQDLSGRNVQVVPVLG
jgi:hypothetical protein